MPVLSCLSLETFRLAQGTQNSLYVPIDFHVQQPFSMGSAQVYNVQWIIIMSQNRTHWVIVVFYFTVCNLFFCLRIKLNSFENIVWRGMGLLFIDILFYSLFLYPWLGKQREMWQCYIFMVSDSCLVNLDRPKVW